ncbi:ATP-binding cassette domain-containing protein [Ornithinibacillus sp. 4-3]|uniref:UvrABC system protein A n=1 Tax=Ornithinibacillus sp. 4-3 TaxID=3231488 RepID=A0AB39HT75_9BACI
MFVLCAYCEHKQSRLTRSNFSANTMEGACPTCSGIGEQVQMDWEKVVDVSLSLEDGAIVIFDKGYKQYMLSILYKAFAFYELADVKEKAVQAWTDDHRKILYEGVEQANINPEKGFPKNVTSGKFEGLAPFLWRRYQDKQGTEDKILDFFQTTTCSSCHGEKLNPVSRAVTVNKIRLPELSTYSLEQLYQWIMELKEELSDKQRAHVDVFLLDIATKLKRLLKVGVGYLTMNRQVITLSGGEQQKIKLAATLDSTLTGVIYLLDEPTTGLHSKDTVGMIDLLKNMRNLGNTIIVIEHDTEVMRASDVIIDIGPGAGNFGGEIIGLGTLDELAEQTASVTGNYLQKTESLKEKTRPVENSFKLEHVTRHNLKDFSVSFPKNCLTVVAGASGSGKSTLIFDVLANQEDLDFDQVITVQQSSITKMRRSNVATFTDAFTGIRTLFSKLEKAKEQGFTSKHFSFNTAGGRCENCEGLGVVPSNMMFFDHIELTCPVCQGKRFKDEILEITWQGHSISQILDLSVTEACSLFKAEKKLAKTFALLEDVGLGYVTLGQSLTTLSGGEGQRLKLAKELLTAKKGKMMFLIDEPTTGLHPIDIEHFIVLLNKMVDAGHTVIIVEHNEQMMRAADWLIELGPEGGDKGGTLIAEGTPEQIKEKQASLIGKFL